MNFKFHTSPVLFVCFIGIVIFNSCATQTKESEETIHVQLDQEGALFSERGQPILYYQIKTKDKDGLYPRANYIHPLYDIYGEVITEDFPEDHRHHRGIFWSWHRILVDGLPMGDSWECKDFTWELVNEPLIQRYKNFSSLTSSFYWKSPHLKSDGNMVPFLEETVVLQTFQKEQNYRVIDIEISLKALVQNVSIGGSDDEKGYGGFSTRIKMPNNLSFHSGEQPITPQNTSITAEDYMDISGSFSPKNKKSGILIIQGPENPEPRKEWILRQRNSMQNAVFPGKNLIHLSSDMDLRLNYRLILYNDELEEMEKMRLIDQYRKAKKS